MDAALEQILARAQARPRNLSVDDLTRLVSLEDPAERRAVYAAAYAQKCRVAGKRVSMRGLIEIGNVCAKDCLYCGIRKSNGKAARYRLDEAAQSKTATAPAQSAEQVNGSAASAAITITTAQSQTATAPAQSAQQAKSAASAAKTSAQSQTATTIPISAP